MKAAEGQAHVAQGIERRFPKPCVAGSNPAVGALELQRCDGLRAARISRSSPGVVPDGLEAFESDLGAATENPTVDFPTPTVPPQLHGPLQPTSWQ